MYLLIYLLTIIIITTLRTFDSGKSSHSVGLLMWHCMVLELISAAVNVAVVTISLIALLVCTHSNAIYQGIRRLYRAFLTIIVTIIIIIIPLIIIINSEMGFVFSRLYSVV